MKRTLSAGSSGKESGSSKIAKMNGSSDLPESFYCTQPVDFSKPLDTSVLNGKSVIVTGGSSGIGLACVEALAEAG